MLLQLFISKSFRDSIPSFRKRDCGEKLFSLLLLATGLIAFFIVPYPFAGVSRLLRVKVMCLAPWFSCACLSHPEYSLPLWGVCAHRCSEWIRACSRERPTLSSRMPARNTFSYYLVSLAHPWDKTSPSRGQMESPRGHAHQ